MPLSDVARCVTTRAQMSGDREARMAAHRVRMTVPGFDISGSNVVFVIDSTRRMASGELEKLGELHVSRGSLEWWPKGAKQYRREVRWEQFAGWIEVNGRRS